MVGGVEEARRRGNESLYGDREEGTDNGEDDFTSECAGEEVRDPSGTEVEPVAAIERAFYFSSGIGDFDVKRK